MRYDRQRTLAIPIAAITLASDSAIPIVRFRPPKVLAEQWQCSLYANVLSVQSSVPMFLHFFLQTDGLQTDGSRLFREVGEEKWACVFAMFDATKFPILHHFDYFRAFTLQVLTFLTSFRAAQPWLTLDCSTWCGGIVVHSSECPSR